MHAPKNPIIRAIAALPLLPLAACGAKAPNLENPEAATLREFQEQPTATVVEKTRLDPEQTGLAQGTVIKITKAIQGALIASLEDPAIEQDAYLSLPSRTVLEAENGQRFICVMGFAGIHNGGEPLNESIYLVTCEDGTPEPGTTLTPIGELPSSFRGSLDTWLDTMNEDPEGARDTLCGGIHF